MALNSMANIEKAFQSNNLADYLTGISQCSKAIRENPFPLFVNGLLVRLAEIFQGDKVVKMEQSLNQIRLRIVKLLNECEIDLSLAASPDEIIRRIMKVSHSNDYKSRSLAMLFFSAVSPVVCSDKKVHYLLAEGLDCDDLTELTSAIIATGSLAHLSSEFASIVSEKIGSMLCQDQIDTATKVRLLDNLAFFDENIEITKYCMELGRHLLRTKPEQRISVAIISSLTELSKRNGLALGNQITLILDEIGSITSNEALLNCCLTNLLDLAELPHQWSAEQVKRLFNYRDNVWIHESNKPLTLWLQCLNYLIKHTHAGILTNDEFLECLTPLSTSPNFTVKIQLVEVIYSQMKGAKKSEYETMLNNCFSEIMTELSNKASEVDMNDRIKFYDMISNYIRRDNFTILNIDELGFATFLMQFDNNYPKEVFLKSLETLNLLCDIKPEISLSISNRALEILKNNFGHLEQKQLSDAPIELFSLALQPTNASKIVELIKDVQNELSDNKKWWFGFKLARLGFRFGHWTNVSAPLLEQIQVHCNTIEVSTFIMSLIYLAKSELPKEFDVTALNASRSNLQHAILLLEPLVKNSRNSANFSFALNYINCLYELFGAFNTILVTLNSNMGFGPDQNSSFHMNYIGKALEKAQEQFCDVRQKWTNLQQSSFDADENTHQHLELFSRYCLLFESILTRIFASEVIDLAQMQQIATSSVNRQLETLINWGITQTNGSIHAVTGPLNERINIWQNNFTCFSKIFHHLSSVSIFLPRYFFQQQCQTKIKLNVSPQPKENEQTLTLTTKHLAMSVEGIIETTNPKPIQNITVYVRVYTDRELEPKITETRSCQAHDNYFKVHFLLTISKNSEIVTSLMFTDSDEKRSWKSENLNRLNVIRE